MKKYLAVACLAVLLSGCVVAPLPPASRGSSSVVVYPQVDFVYYWDPVVSRHYYEDRGSRRYMPHGWRDDRDHGRGRGHGHGRGHD